MINIVEKTTMKLPGVTSLFVTFDFNMRIVQELKMLSNVNYDQDTKTWEVPITSLSELVDRLCVIDDINITVAQGDNSSKSKVLYPSVDTYRTKPFDYQLEGIQWGLNHDSWLLLDAPGLGKSLQLIYLAEELKRRENIEHCLIICGINTLKTNWKSEIEKHSSLDCMILGQRINRKGQLVIDGINKRIEHLKNPIKEFFVIVNIETLRCDDVVKLINSNKHNKFDAIFLDEAHVCKSTTSAQGKNLLKLKKAKYKVGATGTLLLNNPMDAYVPLKWIGAERSTYTNFKYYYCNFGGPFGNDFLGFKNLDTLKNQLDKFSLRRTKDILKLPPKNVINEYVDMNDQQSMFYENIKQGIVDQVDKVHMSTANLLAMVSRLRQATACPSILTTENIVSSKVDRAVDLAEQITSSGDKVVIFSTFKETVKILSEKLSHLGIVVATGDNNDFEVEHAKQEFQNNSDVKIFLGTWQKCGTGITLTSGSYMIFIDHPWTAAQCEQAEDRIHRIGTNKSVFIYRLIARNTIDERVLELVNDKKALSSYIVDDEIPPEYIDSLRKYIEDLS
jgi:SNF2 family DNA or RNA helicase